MALAIQSGIPVDTWLAGDDRDLDTALDIMYEQNKQIEQARRK